MCSQILKLIPRTDFERLVKATGAENIALARIIHDEHNIAV
jgi:hypothetical protein